MNTLGDYTPGGNTNDPPAYSETDGSGPEGAPTQQQEQEWDWLFDFISSFLRSPTWTVPLTNWIDENCGHFTTEDENKLSYTTIHQKFIELVESLLSKNLKEIGISDEQFVAAVASGACSSDSINRIVFGQILAVDDFLTFKKMMTQRNAELEVESMKTLSTYSPSDEEEAQLQLELAIALSQTESAPQPSAQAAKAFSEDDLAIALRLSMLDVEKHQTEYEREQAELEHVIAMSLAAEAERLRLREVMEQLEREEREAQEAAAAAAAAAKKAPPAQASVPKSIAPPATVAAPPIVHGKPLGKAPLPPMSIKAPATLVDPTSALASVAPSASAATSSSSPPAAASSSSSSRSALPPISGSSSSSGSLPKLGGLPPLTLGRLGMGPSSSGLDVPLAEAQKQHDNNVKAAEILFAKNQALLKESKEQAAKTLSEEELARRKEFLLKQREILLRKKKQEREQDLEKFEQEKAELETSAAGPKKLSEQEEVERKRAALKGALVQHLKSVHTEVEIKRASSLEQREQLSLQQQFAEMEQKRRQKESSMKEENEQRKKQELERKQTMQRIAEGMAQNRLED